MRLSPLQSQNNMKASIIIFNICVIQIYIFPIAENKKKRTQHFCSNIFKKKSVIEIEKKSRGFIMSNNTIETNKLVENNKMTCIHHTNKYYEVFQKLF